MEGVQEADAEVIIIARGDAGVRAGDADGGQTRITKDGAAGNGAAGAVGAQHQAHVLAHQLRGGGGRLGGVGGVVGIDQLDAIGLPADYHRGGFLVGVLHAQHLLLAARAGVAGGGLEDADFDHLVPAGGLGIPGTAGGLGIPGTAAAGRLSAMTRARSIAKNFLILFILLYK